MQLAEKAELPWDSQQRLNRGGLFSSPLPSLPISIQLVKADSLFLKVQSAFFAFHRRPFLGTALMVSVALFLITVLVLPWVSHYKVSSEG